MEHSSRPPGFCPDCRRPLPPGGGPHLRCPYCALPLTGPAADQVREIDAEMQRLAQRRGVLLAGLRAGAGPVPTVPPTLPVPPGAMPPAVPQQHRFPPPWPAGVPGGPGAGPAGAEASRPAVRDVLLVLGGVLLTVAALAFALLSWGGLGIGGRAAVLGAVTLAGAGLPVLLLRRGLAATAESVAAVGLVLLLLDAYALHQVAVPETDGVGYAAVALAVLAALWAGYGLLLPRPGLRGPLPVAVALAQLPLPLGAVALAAGPHGIAWALLVTGAADVAMTTAAGRRGVPGAVRVTAAVGGLVTGAPALLLAGSLSFGAQDPGAAAEAGALLVAAAGVLLGAAAGQADRVLAVTPGVVAGLALVAAAGGAVRVYLPSSEWHVTGYLLCATALLAAAWAAVAAAPAALTGAAPAGRTAAGPRSRAAALPGLRHGLAGVPAGALLVHGAALLWALPGVLEAALLPLSRTRGVWEGAPAVPEAAPSVLVVPAVCAAVLAVAGRLPALRAWRGRAEAGAVAAGTAAVVVAPPVLGLPYAAVPVVLVALVGVLLAVAVLVGRDDAASGTASGAAADTAAGAALVAAGTATGWALAEEAATPAVLAVLGAAFAAAAWRAAAGPRGRQGWAGGAFAVSAVLCAAGLAGAVSAVLGAGAPVAGFAVLAVALGTVPVAAWLRGGFRGLSVAVEGAGYAVACGALALTVPRPALLSVALAACAAGAGGVALRADRRAPAGWAAGGLLVAALWVRLYAWEVTVPEAYTLPLAAAALAAGWLRGRAGARLPSWDAYGTGLALAFLPSLVVLWGDPGWQRPLLAGAAALGVTLLGARLRLQAPLLLGGAALAVTGVHELGPYVAQLAGLLPRWLPPALAGLLLLGVGATYERRLRDARRLRTAWQRLG